VGVLSFAELELVNESIDTPNFGFDGSSEFKFSCELQAFTHSERLEKDIILLDVGRES